MNKRLLFEGWTVIRFWGEDVKKHIGDCVQVVEDAIFEAILLEDRYEDWAEESQLDRTAGE